MRCYVFILSTLISASLSAQKINIEPFLPLTEGTVWTLTGTSKITGPLTDISAYTTATASATLYGYFDGHKVISVKGSMVSDRFDIPLYPQTRLNASFELYLSVKDGSVYAHAGSSSYSVGPLQGSEYLVYDSPIRVFPTFIEIGDYYSYRGSANGGEYTISGAYQFPTTANADLSIGEVEALKMLLTSPYEVLDYGLWLSRDLGIVQLDLDGVSSGYTLDVSVTIRQVNRSYRLQPIYNFWDMEYPVENLDFKWNKTYGWLDISHYPYVYSYKHGWLYHHTHDPADSTIYHYDIGWYWTAIEDLPSIYYYDENGWFHFTD